jgi:hypothetical protein
MEAAGAAQEAGKNLEMTRTIILFVDAARGRRHYAIAKSGVRITFAQSGHQLKRHTLSRMERPLRVIRVGSAMSALCPVCG